MLTTCWQLPANVPSRPAQVWPAIPPTGLAQAKASPGFPLGPKQGQAPDPLKQFRKYLATNCHSASLPSSPSHGATP